MNTPETRSGGKSTEQASQVDGLDALEAQIRECFGRVAYSHKTHEQCADILLVRLARLKNVQIVLSVLVSGALVSTVAGDNTAVKIVATVLSALLAGINLYFKNYNYGQQAQTHKETAGQLWNVRESYLSLLTDLHDHRIDPLKAAAQRDTLQKELHAIYLKAPRTNSKAYKEAQSALKFKEDLTFSVTEIDAFLPAPLKRGTINPGQKES